jgi:hypothetical protein
LRAVLIAITEGADPPRDSAARSSGGRPLALRQLDFALACGCEEVLALGEPGSPEIALLGRAARARGAVVRLVGDAHGLLGLLNTTDELLVLEAGLLPESPVAAKALSAGPGVLVLPADAAIAAGFERVDRDRAWAGAAMIPGTLIERLAELPPDIDAPAALLRIALQARVPDRHLPHAVLEDGSWLLVEGGVVPAQLDGWRRGQLETAPPYDLTGRLAQAALKRWPEQLRADASIIGALQAGSVLTLLGAILLSWYGHPSPGLALLAPSALSAALAQRLEKIGAGPFARRKRRWRPETIFTWALDLALGVCGALAIGGAWLGRIFPSAVLLIGLHGRTPAERRPTMAILSDRMVLASLAALATALDLSEPVLMLLALVFLISDRKPRDER